MGPLKSKKFDMAIGSAVGNYGALNQEEQDHFIAFTQKDEFKNRRDLVKEILKFNQFLDAAAIDAGNSRPNRISWMDNKFFTTMLVFVVATSVITVSASIYYYKF